MKVKLECEFEIPDSVLAEYEVVAYRLPKKDDICVTQKGAVFTSYVDFVCDKYVIIARKWQWPAGFDGVAAMARSSDGRLLGFRKPPEQSACGWTMYGFCFEIYEWAFPDIFLNFPRPDRWQDSLRINPNFQQ